MRISDWSSDVCSSDLIDINELVAEVLTLYGWDPNGGLVRNDGQSVKIEAEFDSEVPIVEGDPTQLRQVTHNLLANRSEEHTSELQSLMRISYAVFCLKKKKSPIQNRQHSYMTKKIDKCN